MITSELKIFTVMYRKPIKFEFNSNEYNLYILDGDNLIYTPPPSYGDVGYDFQTVFYYAESWKPCNNGDFGYDNQEYIKLLTTVKQVYYNFINYKTSEEIINEIKNAKQDEDTSTLDKIDAFNKLINMI